MLDHVVWMESNLQPHLWSRGDLREQNKNIPLDLALGPAVELVPAPVGHVLMILGVSPRASVCSKVQGIPDLGIKDRMVDDRHDTRLGSHCGTVECISVRDAVWQTILMNLSPDKHVVRLCSSRLNLTDFQARQANQ